MRLVTTVNIPPRTCESGGGTSASKGLTLLELLVTLAILAILASIAAPNLQTLRTGAQRRAAVSTLNDAVSFARAQAVTQAVPVTLCATDNPEAATPSCSGDNEWESGILVASATGPLQIFSAQPNGVTIRAVGFSSTSSFTFSIAGDLVASGTFVTCSPEGSAEAQALVMNISGLNRVGVDSDGDGTVEDHTGAEVTCP